MRKPLRHKSIQRVFIHSRCVTDFKRQGIRAGAATCGNRQDLCAQSKTEGDVISIDFDLTIAVGRRGFSFYFN